jgi:chromosomal replication initiation ATPase DnaA
MQGPEAPPPAQGNVVAFRPGTSAPLPEPVTSWDRARSRLHADDPAVFEAWFRQLRVGSSATAQDAIFELRAPSRFHASFVSTHHLHHLLAALRQEGLASAGVLVVAAQDS